MDRPRLKAGEILAEKGSVTTNTLRGLRSIPIGFALGFAFSLVFVFAF